MRENISLFFPVAIKFYWYWLSVVLSFSTTTPRTRSMNANLIAACNAARNASHRGDKSALALCNTAIGLIERSAAPKLVTQLERVNPGAGCPCFV